MFGRGYYYIRHPKHFWHHIFVKWPIHYGYCDKHKEVRGKVVLSIDSMEWLQCRICGMGLRKTWGFGLPDYWSERYHERNRKRYNKLQKAIQRKNDKPMDKS